VRGTTWKDHIVANEAGALLMHFVLTVMPTSVSIGRLGRLNGRPLYCVGLSCSLILFRLHSLSKLLLMQIEQKLIAVSIMLNLF